ncbi:helix-turn-helix domain-containing protein [Enterococcus saccharolyticus]|uniref:helix-turn-helix domain-containing protein n=1 Tax=Enterococcus saccharolyticus TaxID=41997 RepID=UPI0039E00158
MIRAKKVRLRPTTEQEKQLWQSSGTARWIFNWTLGTGLSRSNDLPSKLTFTKQYQL